MEYLRHSLSLIQESLAQGQRNFIIAGGDGLLNEAVNAIFTQPAVDPEIVTLAMIPLGKGNDWARTFSIPFDLEAAVRVIRAGKTLRHDIPIPAEVSMSNRTQNVGLKPMEKLWENHHSALRSFRRRSMWLSPESLAP